MTSDDLNRSIGFLLQHQAHLSTQLEQLAADVKETRALVNETTASVNEISARQDRHHEMDRATLQVLAELVALQTLRLNRQEGFVEETRAWQQEFDDDARKRHDELLVRLNRIIEKLRQQSN